MTVDTGITNEVFTLKSEIELIDIFNEIIEKKADKVLQWALNFEKTDKVVVIGTYFTGIGIVKKLSRHFDSIMLIDIYPHLEELLHTPIGGNISEEELSKITFSNNLDLIYSGDVVIDTTGFGGITVDQSKRFDVKGFLIEDPIAEDNDILLQNKNNIYDRLNAVKSFNKAVIKTKGIDTKTSGTMTLSIGVLNNSLNQSLARKGVLYAACEMGFFEEIIFKERNISLFLENIIKPALKVSTIDLFNCDEILKEQLDSIKCEIICG